MTFERRGQLFCLSGGRVLIWRRLNKLNWKTNIEAAAESGKVGSTAYEKAEILQRVQQNDDFWSVSCGMCRVLCCGLTGEQHQSSLIRKTAPWIWLQTSNWSCGEDKLLFIKILTTLCIIYWTVSRKPSLAGWFSSSSTRTDTRNVSYHISLHYISVSQTGICRIILWLSSFCAVDIICHHFNCCNKNWPKYGLCKVFLLVLSSHLLHKISSDDSSCLQVVSLLVQPPTTHTCT